MNGEGDDRTPSSLPRWVAILLLSLAGLLLEVGYTRIISYKLWYYYTYLVIGLALLGIGSGGVVVATVRRLRDWSTERVLAVFSTAGAAVIAAGYLFVAWLPLDTRAIWDYGTRSSVENLALLGLLCLVLFLSFLPLGVMVSVLLGRAGVGVGRMYFADLVGAGAGCLVAVPLISRLGPPVVVWLAALLFAAVGAAARPRQLPAYGLCALLAAGVLLRSPLPDVRPETQKIDGRHALFSGWGPVFRVDVFGFYDRPDDRLLGHDGTYGSGIHRFDGDPAAIDDFDHDPRLSPFQILGGPPGKELIIGSAGGNEILASLGFGAKDIEGVELNPVTVGLLKDRFADFTGHLLERPEVHVTQGDGRSYLARSDTNYDLIWYVAPDSYAASNAASSGAFVLSESYLYTDEMIQETLRHLSDDGIMVVQFGEIDLEGIPNRTARYIVTARDALAAIGVDDPGQHILVAGFLVDGIGDLSTIVVKRTPFTDDEVERFVDGLDTITNADGHSVLAHAPGHAPLPSLDDLDLLAGGTDDQVAAAVDAFPRSITVVRDDAPFFWHFTPFGDVLRNITHSIPANDPEISIGERVLVLLLGFTVLYAAVFLLLPFFVVRRDWGKLPAKGPSIAYFAALGLGFMLFEITMIQRLTRFLGYPTYSLTVTLASILVATGLGSLLSDRLRSRARPAMVVVLAVLVGLALFYRFGLDGLTDALLDRSLGIRVVVALLVLAPLGLCLGMFMPLGLAAVTATGEDGERYVAWAWAINGFFSVIGSVLTTMLSMTFGFARVQLGALVVYGFAVLVFGSLQRRLAVVGSDP